MQALLQWNNMIFALPMAVGALLLVVSTMRLGHHSGGHHGGHPGGLGHGLAHGAGHGIAHAHAPAPHASSLHTQATPAHAGPSHPASAQGADAHPQPVHATHSAHHGTTEKEAAGEWQNVNVANTLAIHLNGPRHAPLAMVAEAFLLLWGICGLSLSRAMVSDPSPTAGRMLPVLVLALAAGLVGAKIAAMLIARILPADETLVVSRDALFGMTGEVAFQVTEGAGRIHVYDQFGTLHDESCRVAAAYPPIERGRSAMVVDRDARGSLIVEEVPASHG